MLCPPQTLILISKENVCRHLLPLEKKMFKIKSQPSCGALVVKVWESLQVWEEISKKQNPQKKVVGNVCRYTSVVMGKAQ